MDFPDLTVPIGTLFLSEYSWKLTFLISSKQISMNKSKGKNLFLNFVRLESRKTRFSMPYQYSSTKSIEDIGCW